MFLTFVNLHRGSQWVSLRSVCEIIVMESVYIVKEELPN